MGRQGDSALTLEGLLEDFGLDADGAEQTLAWARVRAAELVANAPDNLLELLESDVPRRARPAARSEELPAIPSESTGAPEPVEDDGDNSMDIDVDEDEVEEEVTHPVDVSDAPEAEVPDTTEELDIEDADIEMLEDDDLELVEVDDDGAPLDEDGEPDLVALAGMSQKIDTSDLDADEDPAVDALIAGLDED